MSHTAAVLVELGAVIFALGLLGRLASRIGLSPIPLYLLGGLAFGEGGLLPLATSEEFIEVGAEIGVVLLLLTLGLEYSADELIGNLRTQLPSGLVDLVLNATPGVAAGLLLGMGPVGAVAMGGVTWVTSSGITAKVLRDLRRLGNRETPAVLSVLVLEDLMMALYLPVLTALLAGASLLVSSLRVAAALAAVVLALLLALRFGAPLSRFIFSSNDEVLLLKVLGLGLLVAGLASVLEVSAAVGAFLVGIALSGRVAESAQDVLGPLRDLFAAVFFVFFGLRTDPGALPDVALPALLLGAFGVVTKLLTGAYAARRAGVASLGQARAGAALVPRGEFNIVIAGLAIAAGTVPLLGPLAAAYVLLMAIVGPLLARIAEPLARAVNRARRTVRPGQSH